MATGTKIFLAHSSVDKEQVRKLYLTLKEQGLCPWLDEKDLLPGQHWPTEISKAIRQCDFFIACLSETAIGKQGYLHKEFRMALDVYAEKPFGSIYFIPLKLDACDLPDIHLPLLGFNLREVQWLDYWKPNGLERLLKVVGNKKKDIDESPVKPVQNKVKKNEDVFNILNPQQTADPLENQSDGALHKKSELGMEFVFIRPGTFIMGSPSTEACRRNCETEQKVTLTQGFYLQTTPVTQAQWQEVMGDNPSRFKKNGDDCPVERVSWNDAQEFIQKLNKQKTGRGYRLPTEAQWEYACRAGTNTAFSFGHTLTTDQANYNGKNPYRNSFKGSFRKRTTPVMRFAPNQWGVYDMHGNVWEWCQDYFADYPGKSITDPKGPSFGNKRVRRGGSWYSGAKNCRSAFRYDNYPSYRGDDCGFRLAAT